MQVHFDCGTNTIEADDNLGGVGFPINCGCWSCEYCAERNKRRLKRDICFGKPNRFVTVTCREGEFGDPITARREIARAWHLVVQRWRRLKDSNKCHYAVVVERHKNDWPHLHIAWVGPWLDEAWLSRQMAELLNSPIVEVVRVRTKRGIASYLAKYLGKAPHQFGSMKRYWFSHGYPRTKRERHATHRFVLDKKSTRNRSFAEMIADWTRLNHDIQYFQWGGAGWGHWWPTGPPPRPADRGYWHFRSGIPHLRTKRGWSA